MNFRALATFETAKLNRDLALGHIATAISAKDASPPTDTIHRTATVADVTGARDGASHWRDGSTHDAALRVTCGHAIDYGIRGSRVNSQSRDECGAGESGEHEQAHSPLLCLHRSPMRSCAQILRHQIGMKSVQYRSPLSEISAARRQAEIEALA
jgi:hypothetical protein